MQGSAAGDFGHFFNTLCRRERRSSHQLALQVRMLLQGVFTEITVNIGVEGDIELAAKAAVIGGGSQRMEVRPTLGAREVP